MKKKVFFLIATCLMLAVMCNFTVFAEEWEWEKFYDGDDTICILTPEGTLVSRDQKIYNARNEVLSTVIAQITNEGKGNLGILLHTMCHVEVDKIRQQAFLDRWDEGRDAWVNIDSYNFVATKDEYPDGLYQLISTETIKGQTTGYYYRVRGLHAVWRNGVQDGFSSKTDGVLLTPN